MLGYRHLLLAAFSDRNAREYREEHIYQVNYVSMDPWNLDLGGRNMVL